MVSEKYQFLKEKFIETMMAFAYRSAGMPSRTEYAEVKWNEFVFAHTFRRPYHNIDHIDQCINLFDLYVNPKNPAYYEGMLALFFHDYVYNPLAVDNEKKSYDTMINLLEFQVPTSFVPGSNAAIIPQNVYGIVLSPEQKTRVREYILATKHNTTPTDQITSLICDIDNSILASNWEKFDDYEKKVEEEYLDHFSKADFDYGRIKFIISCLEKENIFISHVLPVVYEQRARSNLFRSLKNRIDIAFQKS